MPRRNYVPTETDRLTGARLRELRHRRGETLGETTERSGFGRDRSTLAATERGERMLTEIEATKLAAHFDTTVDKIITHPYRPALQPVVRTEQDWLGNKEEAKPALFAVPDPVTQIEAPVAGFGRTLVIDLDAPPSPDEYRLTVWIPYLENRYATEQKAS